MPATVVSFVRATALVAKNILAAVTIISARISPNEKAQLPRKPSGLSAASCWADPFDCRTPRQIIRTEPYRDANEGKEYPRVHSKSRKDKYWNEDKPSDGG